MVYNGILNLPSAKTPFILRKGTILSIWIGVVPFFTFQKNINLGVIIQARIHS